MKEDESLDKRKAGGRSTGHYRLGQRAQTPEAAIQLAEGSSAPTFPDAISLPAGTGRHMP